MCCGRERGETAAAAAAAVPAAAAAAKSHPCLAAFPDKRLNTGARGETTAGGFYSGQHVGTAAGPGKRTRRLRHDVKSEIKIRRRSTRTAPAALAASFDTKVAPFRASSKPEVLWDSDATG